MVIEITQHSFYFTTPLSLSCRRPTPPPPPNAAHEVGHRPPPPQMLLLLLRRKVRFRNGNGKLWEQLWQRQRESQSTLWYNLRTGRVLMMDDINCNTSLPPPPALFLVLQWNKYTDQGKTIWMMGMSNFWPLKNWGNFSSVDGSRHFTSTRFLLLTVLKDSAKKKRLLVVW
jgi:hypothetical protein